MNNYVRMLASSEFITDMLVSNIITLSETEIQQDIYYYQKFIDCNIANLKNIYENLEFFKGRKKKEYECKEFNVLLSRMKIEIDCLEQQYIILDKYDVNISEMKDVMFSNITHIQNIVEKMYKLENEVL